MNINGYIFDINKIAEFVFGNQNDKTNEVEILEQFVYDDELCKMVPATKEVKEVKLHDFTAQNNIRYDMIKMFIEMLDGVENEATMSLGQGLIFNTMKAYELIKDINDSNDE